jgi:hypothetical protein
VGRQRHDEIGVRLGDIRAGVASFEVSGRGAWGINQAVCLAPIDHVMTSRLKSVVPNLRATLIIIKVIGVNN